MLNMTVRNTAKLIRAKSKSENVRLGRFFTKKETARLMANMLTLDESKTAYTVLDPGAGTGILASAVIEEICLRCKNCKIFMQRKGPATAGPMIFSFSCRSHSRCNPSAASG